MDSLALQDNAIVSLAGARRRYRAEIARALMAISEIPEVAAAVRHWAGALGPEAVAGAEKFIAEQDSHLFSAAYDFHLAAGECTRRAAEPAHPREPFNSKTTNQNAHA